jgi:hypothetical protein
VASASSSFSSRLKSAKFAESLVPFCFTENPHGHVCVAVFCGQWSHSAQLNRIAIVERGVMARKNPVKVHICTLRSTGRNCTVGGFLPVGNFALSL